MSKERACADTIVASEVNERVGLFCAMFELEPPVFVGDENEEEMSPETGAFISWCGKVGVSLDWVMFGDMRPLLNAYREKINWASDIVGNLNKLDDLKKSQAILAFRAIGQGADPDLVWDTLLEEAGKKIPQGNSAL